MVVRASLPHDRFGPSGRMCMRDPRAAARELAISLGAIACMPPGVARHAALVGAFIDAGELVHGLAAYPDGTAGTAIGEAGGLLLAELADSIGASWSSGFQHMGSETATLLALLSLAAHPWPSEIELHHGRWSRMQTSVGHAPRSV